MKETAFRTLMLLTTLFAVVVIFQATVRSPKPGVAQVRPANLVYPREDPNETPAKAPIRPPAVITVVTEAPGVWLEDEPEDPNEPDESPPPVPE